MNRKSIFLLACGLLLAPLDSFAAGDSASGKQKAVACASCHGAQGISNSPLWPNLAGQKKLYLEKQIKAFRDGERKDNLMMPFVSRLTDQDIKDLAEYYSSLK